MTSAHAERALKRAALAMTQHGVEKGTLMAAMRRVETMAKTNSLLIEACAIEALAIPLEGHEVSHRGLEPSTTGHPLVDRALEIISLNSHRPLNPESISAELSVTRRTLERAFAEVHSRNVAAEINSCRLQRAKLLLGESRMTVKEVGHAVGFTGSKRMIRAFRREFGLTPMEYRRATS